MVAKVGTCLWFRRLYESYTLWPAAKWSVAKPSSGSYVQRVPASIELQREIPFVIEFGVGDEKAFAGVISLHTISIDNHRAEIGYWMDAAMRGKGIAKIATKMITGYGFDTLGFQRIEAAVDIENIASQKLLDSAGYQREGVLLQRVTRPNGDQIDMVMFSALNQSWVRLD